MSTMFQCDDKETLIAFVYDEVDADTRRVVASHLLTCAACASELEGLRAVRQDLAQWQPPEVALNFEIAQRPATVLRPSRWAMAAVPAWAQVAAAILVFAVGVGVANLRVRYDASGVTVTTGWITPGAATASADAAARSDDWRPALTAVESNLRRELQLVRASNAAARAEGTDFRSAPVQPAAGPNAASVDGAALLRRVQSLINESEQRQRQELAIRLTQFNRELEVQRRADLIKINSDFRQLQGRTGFVEGNQREMVNLLRRVSTQQVP